MARPCSIDGCDRVHSGRGLCRFHLYRLRQNGDPLVSRYDRSPKTGCKAEGCANPHHSKGYCRAHAHRLARHGDPFGGDPDRLSTLAARLAKWLLVGDGCWIWTGTLDNHGYGQVAIGGGRITRVHRVVYRLLVGPIPDGMEPDHLCRARACARPDHLEPVTHRENMRRSRAAREGAAS